MSNPQEQSPRATGPQLSKEQTEGVKHTPGPWIATKKEYGTYTEYSIQTVARDHVKTFIGEVGGGLQDDTEIRANAELIARAPELASSLSRVEGERDELRECLLRVQKAYNEAPSGWLPTEELNLAMVAIHVALYGNTEDLKEGEQQKENV